MTVDTTITWLLELFEKRIFKFQKIVETKPMCIETNVADDSEFAKWRNGKTADLNEAIGELDSVKRLKASGE